MFSKYFHYLHLIKALDITYFIHVFQFMDQLLEKIHSRRMCDKLPHVDVNNQNL